MNKSKNQKNNRNNLSCIIPPYCIFRLKFQIGSHNKYRTEEYIPKRKKKPRRKKTFSPPNNNKREKSIQKSPYCHIKIKWMNF